MSNSILPSGEELHITPTEILRYLNPDGIRQMLRQERLRWKLKPNKDCDYYDNSLLYKYAAELHNGGSYMRMEIRTFPDNGASAGFAGVNVDSGVFGIPHGYDQWDHSMSEESKAFPVNRVMIGAQASINDKSGYGMDNDGNPTPNTQNRMAAILMDPYDGRGYLLTNDHPDYVNNDTRSAADRIPSRAIARIGDIPTRIAQLINDKEFISDPAYRHTDNNFTDSNRFVLDNMDDRTFVYPEIAKDKNGGDFIVNNRIGLNGEPGYAESDGSQKQNTQPDLGQNPDLGDFGDRLGEAVSSYNAGNGFSGVKHEDGYLPGIFRSLEELKRVDLVDQKQTPRTHQSTPGAKRHVNYYIMDGRWTPNWFDRTIYHGSYMAQSLMPSNLELSIDDREPIPYSQISDNFDMSDLYQWRYNRIDTKYKAKDITISIVNSGHDYEVGDILSWVFGEISLKYYVDMVGANGQIMQGHYVQQDVEFDEDPCTYNVGIEFTNTTGVGTGAKLSIQSKATVTSHATQIKNNLYAYVDITPSVRSDDSTEWSDIKIPDTQNGNVVPRSTAAGPAHSGINSGRGGPAPDDTSSETVFYEHGGNATAGVHVHLFRYVINTENPQWVIRDGIQVFTGEWVDQGPMGVERPCDIKALLFSNPDTNNFNNYYKFLLDVLADNMNRCPDGIISNNANAISGLYLHVDQLDPTPDRRFTGWRVDPITSAVTKVDITDRVLYINAATGMMFFYNAGFKSDPVYGYGMSPIGWRPIAGSVTK